MPVIRKIYALLFELKTNDGGIRLLIAWLDRFGNSKYLLPAHPDKCLLEMRPVMWSHSDAGKYWSSNG